MASKKAVFQVRYLSGQVAIGSKGALVKAARTSSRNHEGVIIWGIPLECSRSLIHLLSVGCMLRELPWTIACLREIAVTYPFMVYTANLSDLVCRKSRTCFRDVQMGFRPLLRHQLTKLSHLRLYTALVVSLVAARIVLIAISEKPLTWRERRTASTQSA